VFARAVCEGASHAQDRFILRIAVPDGIRLRRFGCGVRPEFYWWHDWRNGGAEIPRK
jgi:hypothetical protein